MGKNDLYVKVSTDGKNWQQTSTKKGAGKQAVFDEVLTFDGGNKIYVEVYDKDPLKDDKLGEGKVRNRRFVESDCRRSSCPMTLLG